MMNFFAEAASLAAESDPSLGKTSSPVADKYFSSEELKRFTELLAQEMFSHFGILGIAGPQLKRGLRVFLLRTSFINPFNRSYEVFINPVITPVGDATNLRIEFCLSTRGLHWIRRYKTIRLEYFKTDGTREVIELRGSRARIAQHELDHLNGKLISDK